MNESFTINKYLRLFCLSLGSQSLLYLVTLHVELLYQRLGQLLWGQLAPEVISDQGVTGLPAAVRETLCSVPLTLDPREGIL